MKDKLMKTRLGLKTYLMGLVLVAILPVLFFAALLIGFLTFQQLDSTETSLKGTTRALAAAVDEQIVSVKSSLKILSLVEDFDTSNMRDLHRRLSRYVKTQPGWASISLALPNGRQLFNTAKPLGEKLPLWSEQEFFREVQRTNQPGVSGFRVTSFFNWQVITVTMPVMVNKKLEYVLVGNILVESFSQLLADQKLPKDWTGAIIDQDGVIIARSRNREKMVGTKATPTLALILNEKSEQVFHDKNKEGDETFGAYSVSRETNWKVVLGMPASQAKLPTWRLFWLIVGGGSFLLLTTIVLAVLIGQKISNPIIALASTARALGRGEKVELVDSMVVEVFDVSQALKAASEDRAEAEKTVHSLYTKAQEAVELRDTFLSVASHELKTPITTLKLQFQILERMIKNAESIKSEVLSKPFHRVLDQTRRLSTLVDDLLDVSRITSGRLELHNEELDLSNLVEDVVSHFEAESERTGSTITMEKLPGIVGQWDRGRLEQIITNLISNAIKYGNANPIHVTVTRDGPVAHVKVTDQGIGIAKEDQERIFDRFERAVGGRNISGLGLGLWIVKRIVERLDGTISVESSTSGSTFTVQFKIS
jgi:signal transduction histidine kinase